jgi:hypothetical protein
VKRAPLAAGIKEIRFNSDLHKKIMKQFLSRLEMARDEKRKKREESWRASEDTFQAYMPETDMDAVRRAKRSGGQTEYTTISIPYSYAMLLTAHTYYTSVFLGRDPIFQLSGRHGEAQTSEMAMESLLNYQLVSGGGMPALFVWLMDAPKYSHGVIGHYWDKEVFTLSNYVDQPKTFLGVPIPGTNERVLNQTETTGFEGNRLYNVRPQDFYHDPRVPLYRFQEGEFCIVYDKVGWINVARGAADGKFYNLDLIEKDTGSGYAGDDRTTATGRDTNLPGEDISFYRPDDKHPAMIDKYEFHWELTPSEIGLGEGNRPEKWVFTIANKNTIISAQPLGLAHNKYPFDVLTFEVEGYNVFNRSMLEVLDPLNKTMEWLFNSHFFNVRAALNNMFLVDPSKVTIRDLEEPGPGKMIRLKPAGYGQDLRTMMAQFPVQDITRSNLQDSDYVGSLAQRITGVSDNVMGQVNTSGRKTATEVRSSTTFGINRLKTNCEWFSNVGFGPLASKLTMSTQQLYTAEKKYRIVGDQAMWMEAYMNITPDMIAGMYDFVAVDGTMPVDRFAQANMWQQLLGGLSKVPGALQGYDLGKIFAFIAQLGGIKNINKFKIQVVPDGQLQQQAAAGNVVPMTPRNLNEPGQVPGMGSTG